MSSARPAMHHESNSQDIQQVGIIMDILGGHGSVIPDIKTIDKWPNTDGHVQVIDKTRRPIGSSLPVQVKPVNVAKNGLVYDCPVSLLAYAARDPVLVLGVDRRKKKVYWLYLDSYIVKDIDYEDNRATKRLSFEEDHVISKQHKEYIERWTEIVMKNYQRLAGYDAKEEELSKILENTNRIVGKKNDNFIQLHKFIDEFNRLFDADFPTVKKFFYPSAWKMGIAYERYEENKLAYSLYPIHISYNDVQIKEIDDVIARAIRGEGLGFTSMSVKNPIMARPKEYAKELVGGDVMKLVNHKLLKHTGNLALSREFIFAFVDKFHVQLGIMPEVGDQQNVRVLNFAFTSYFPIWIEETYKLLIAKNRNNIAERVARKGYFDPDVLGEIMSEELDEIQKIVGDRLNTHTKTYRVASDKLDIGVFIEALHYVTSLDSKGNVDRLYKKADRSRIQKVGSHWIWDEFSKEDAEENLRTIFKNLPEAYAQVISNNFPTLQRELDFYSKANIIYIYAGIKDSYTSATSGPSYKTYSFYDSSRLEPAIELIDKDKADELDTIVWSSKERANSDIKFIAASHSSLDFLYKETPMLDLIYDILTEKLKNYFQPRM